MSASTGLGSAAAAGSGAARGSDGDGDGDGDGTGGSNVDLHEVVVQEQENVKQAPTQATTLASAAKQQAEAAVVGKGAAATSSEKNHQEEEEEEEEDATAAKSTSFNSKPSKAFKVLGYDNEEQILRAKALARLGLTEDDMFMSAPFFCGPEAQDRLQKLYEKKGYTDKLPSLMGLTPEQILRRKAVDTLGVSEGDIAKDRERRLAALGLAMPPGFEKRPTTVQDVALNCMR